MQDDPDRQIENRKLAPINPWLVTGIVLAILLPLEELAGLGLIAAAGSALLKGKRKGQAQLRCKSDRHAQPQNKQKVKKGSNRIFYLLPCLFVL